MTAEWDVTDGPDDSGEMFERPGKPSDKFPSPYRNEEEGRMANAGAYPPDLSLMTKARHNGVDYEDGTPCTEYVYFFLKV